VTVEDFEADVLRNEERLHKLPDSRACFASRFSRRGTRPGSATRSAGSCGGTTTVRAAPRSTPATGYYTSAFAPGAPRTRAPIRSVFATRTSRTCGTARSTYDALARKAVGRSVKHTLILHTNAVNAAFLPDVIRMFPTAAWKVSTPRARFATRSSTRSRTFSRGREPRLVAREGEGPARPSLPGRGLDVRKADPRRRGNCNGATLRQRARLLNAECVQSARRGPWTRWCISKFRSTTRSAR
jgi:hypothetical protein